MAAANFLVESIDCDCSMASISWEMKVTSSTCCFSAGPQQLPPLHVRVMPPSGPMPTPSGNTTMNWLALARPAKLLFSAYCVPDPNPPCMATSSGTGWPAGNEVGTYR